MPKRFPEIAGLTFKELQAPQALLQLDSAFLSYLAAEEPVLAERLNQYRQGLALEPKTESYFLLEVAPHIEAFIIEQFQIQTAAAKLTSAIAQQDPIFAFKEHIVLRDAKRAMRHAEVVAVDFEKLTAWLLQQVAATDDLELAVAIWAVKLLEDKEQNAAALEQLIQWCVACLTTAVGKCFVANWVSFKLPEKVEFDALVSLQPVPGDALNRLESPPHKLRMRDGFALTDPRMSERQVLNEIHYCVYCHKNDGDFCSKGFPVKRSQPELGFKENPLKEVLTGCPLEEKISEMHVLKRSGFNIAALAMVMLDNPMCPATGHRICNDCMKACIYQKQEPVNIPQIETRVLTDVLSLPWGVEIYDLLTRWNPLRRTQYVAKPYAGKKVCVMGMGPAGFTLAHHLLMEGYAVVGVDGLKIESLHSDLINQPIESFSELEEPLDKRIMAGFGGVAEYGITVRWDKNFLKLIYLTLARRPYFQVFGGVRFGGTLRVEDAWRLGFDHLAIAVGAGLPKELAIPKSLAPGMRQANDFLMALQLTGAAKESSLANLQLRLPAVVIGGGLTGIDTATEAQAYYISQVEKMHLRYHILVGQADEKSVRDKFDRASLEILDEYLQHAEVVLQERHLAATENREPNFIKLIREWGGVTIVYRRAIQDSPAYRSNHEEVAKALEEGIYYGEHLQPEAVETDEFGFAKSLVCQNLQTNQTVTLPARSILVATGARPNVAYEFEHRGTFLKIQGNYARFEDDDHELKPVTETGNCKAKHFGPFTSYDQNERRVTFLGDTHPVFHGSVVKAIASAKRIYPAIVATLGAATSANEQDYIDFRASMQMYFNAECVAIKRLRKDVLEVIVKSPAAAHSFSPGQFYRLQNFETQAKMVHGTLLQSEGIAALGKRDKNSDTLSFIILERGVSTRLVADFNVDAPIALMGPTGVRAKVSDTAETVMIIGSDLAIAYARSFGPACREKGTKVIFVGHFKNAADIFCRDEIEHEAADVAIWLDSASSEEFVNEIAAKFGAQIQKVDRVIVVGDVGLVEAVQAARHSTWKALLKPQATLCASAYAPMQCMLKGVCAQCLVWQVNPETGERKKAVYACSWQEQPLELIEAPNLQERLVQNRVQEILSGLWLDYLKEQQHFAKGQSNGYNGQQFA